MRVAAAATTTTAVVAGLKAGGVVASGHLRDLRDGFEVVTPSAGLTVIAGRTYTIEWTGNFENSLVELDLFHCGSDCQEDECGDWITALCPYGEDGCPDNDGDYDVVMPAPLAGNTSASAYKVRVMDVNDEDNWSCSAAFELTEVEDVVIDEEADWQSGMTVVSPDEGDLAYAGQEYTVLFKYFNEVGSNVDRFSIDLYDAEGDGECGTYVTTICDKPSIGCKDSRGDYDVVIPNNISAGEYKIRVAVFENDDVYDCSGTFDVVSDMFEETDDSVDDMDSMESGVDDDDMSLSFSFSYDV